MSELDALTDKIEAILESISCDRYSLEEQRYVLRKVVYKGATRILRDYPEIIVGRSPGPGEPRKPPPAETDGQRPPYYPNGVGGLLCIALGNCPQQT